MRVVGGPAGVPPEGAAVRAVTSARRQSFPKGLIERSPPLYREGGGGRMHTHIPSPGSDVYTASVSRRVGGRVAPGRALVGREGASLMARHDYTSTGPQGC